MAYDSIDLNKMIASLQDERRRIDDVIQNLERLADDGGPRRRRPPRKRIRNAFPGAVQANAAPRATRSVDG